MADFNGTILTDKGRNLLAKALTGTELKFTKVSLGDGVWNESVNPESLTGLVSKKMDLAINALEVTGDGTARLRFVLSNTGLSEGFFTREIGIYANDPDDGEILYAVTYSKNPDFIPADGVVKVENVTDIYTVVSNAQNVEAVISDTVVIATKDDVKALKTDLESGNITVSVANNANNLGGETPESYAKADLSTTDDNVILNKLKNVDGAGSGLDADLLRGLPADFTCSKSQNGYTKLPNGLIIQWGNDFFNGSDGDNATIITLPISFPNAFLQIVATDVGLGTHPVGISPNDNNSFKVWGRDLDNNYADTAFRWIAIGY